MDLPIKKFIDRLRITIILYTFCDLVDNNTDYGVFRTEIKIQALDFLVRYPDFLSMELMDLMDNDLGIDREEIRRTISFIYENHEPSIRAEEMEKFFHGAYESIDDIIAFLVSVGFIRHESKKRIDGKTYDKLYYVTQDCADKIDKFLKQIPSVKWNFERCELIRKYFGKFSGTDLKSRQYRYSEYRDISYRSHIQNINKEVALAYEQRFNQQLV